MNEEQEIWPYPFWKNINHFSNYLKVFHNADVIAIKDLTDVVCVVAQKMPLNKKPNWIWFLYKFSKGYVALCMSEKHINKTEALMPFFLEHYDKDNKNLRLKRRFGEYGEKC